MTDRRLPGATRAEDEVLLCCARVSPDAATRARLAQLIAGNLDWEAVLNRSWWHRIRPLAWRHLSAQAAGTVPARVLAELAGHASELRERNRRLLGALQDVAGYLEEAALPGLVFKGPTLSQDAYGDLSLRECGDLDLLIDKQDFNAVAAVLTAHGFEPWYPPEAAQGQDFARDFRRADAALDVHWHLSPAWLNYRVDFARMWDSGTPLSPGGSMLRKLAPEESLAVLCIHGTKHWWERLRWIVDIAEMINRGMIRDWDCVEAAAVDSRCRRSLALGLWLAGHLLSADLPDGILERLEATPGISRLGRQVHRWIGHAEHSPAQRGLPQRFLFRMGVCERKRDQLSQLVRYLAFRPFSSC